MRQILVFFVLSLSLCPSVSGQDTDKLPVITVVGTAQVQVAPDEVNISLEVTKTDKDLQTAKRLNDDSVRRILELTHRFEIAPQDVKTDYISVEMKYESIRDAKTKIYDADGDEVGKRVFRGYVVSKTVIVKLTNILRFEEFFSELLKTGLSEVNKVHFETSRLRENKDKAREMAMKAAREKAVSMAAAVGQTIGKAVRITELNQNYGSGANMTSNALSVDGGFTQDVATFAPGAIKVEAQVTVSFLLN